MPTATFLLATERTVLLPFRDADHAELLALFRDPEVRVSLLDDVLVTPAWMEAEIEASQRRFARFGTGLWAVRRRNASGIVGFAGFREFFDPPELQLLYGLLPSCRGLGLAGEVTAAVCAFAFDELARDSVSATVDAPNRASVRVLERLGMSCDGREPDGALHFTVDRDTWAGRTRPGAAAAEAATN
ncbi:MAG: GNAT family N-acetyltransferase [Planctomycetes bacterium]|nr:GNAT family N-acetyltransferase [Planctomycetota bacterium]